MNIRPEQFDVLKELINIGVARAAGMLNQMLHHPINLEVPQIKLFPSDMLEKELQKLGRERLATVRMLFKGSFSGTAALVFPTVSASKLVAALSEDDPETSDLDSVRIGALSEVGNIVLNGVMGSIGNVLKEQISYSVPTYVEESIASLVATSRSDPTGAILLAETRFSIERLQVGGDIILLFESAFDALLATIDRMLEADLG